MAKKEKEASQSIQVDGDEKTIALPTEHFEADGEEYKFTVAIFNLKSKVITAAEALEDPEVLAELVELKAGVIAKVKK
jgi:hypothetical protein